MVTGKTLAEFAAHLPALYLDIALDGAVYLKTNYGVEDQNLTSWDLFDEAQAGQALALAEEAVTIARRMMAQLTGEGQA
ncbi:MAG: hypothetical protein N2378_12200 [Chloroflexaceae bacterium]|nr:hypothetical protein [Chloroflexaceae bacterium]